MLYSRLNAQNRQVWKNMKTVICNFSLFPYIVNNLIKCLSSLLFVAVVVCKHLH